MILQSCFSRYDPLNSTYHHDLEGDGLICSAIDILPTEFAKEVQFLFRLLFVNKKAFLDIA